MNTQIVPAAEANAMGFMVGPSTVTMTSLELVDFINEHRKEAAVRDGRPFPSQGHAELAHADFLKKVPDVLGKDAGNFSSIYFDSMNRGKPCYRFPKREACLMAMSYSYDIQAKVFDRMTALESAAAPSLPDFSSPAAAARAWAEQYEARALAVATKAEIGSRREATAMNTASQATKKANALALQLDRSKEYATVKRMEMLYHGQKFNWRLLKSTAIEMGMPAIDVFDANYGTVKAYHADVWRETFAVSLDGEVTA